MVIGRSYTVDLVEPIMWQHGSHSFYSTREMGVWTEHPGVVLEPSREVPLVGDVRLALVEDSLVWSIQGYLPEESVETRTHPDVVETAAEPALALRIVRATGNVDYRVAASRNTLRMWDASQPTVPTVGVLPAGLRVGIYDARLVSVEIERWAGDRPRRPGRGTLDNARSWVRHLRH